MLKWGYFLYAVFGVNYFVAFPQFITQYFYFWSKATVYLKWYLREPVFLKNHRNNNNKTKIKTKKPTTTTCFSKRKKKFVNNKFTWKYLRGVTPVQLFSREFCKNLNSTFFIERILKTAPVKYHKQSQTFFKINIH